MAEHDPALVEKAAEGAALVFGWQHLARYSGQSPEWLEKTLAAMTRVVLDAVAPAIREAALLEAARHFEYEMSRTWGGDAHWLSTGNRVADVVAECLREMAVQQREEPTDGR